MSKAPHPNDLFMWPDGTWVYREDYNEAEYRFMGDDFETVATSDPRYEALTVATNDPNSFPDTEHDWDRRNADKIDGFDRDDLGESPDF